jgi:hypothetical protein
MSEYTELQRVLKARFIVVDLFWAENVQSAQATDYPTHKPVERETFSNSIFSTQSHPFPALPSPSPLDTHAVLTAT